MRIGVDDPRLRLALLGAAALGLALVAAVAGGRVRDALLAGVDALGASAPLVFLVLYVLLSLLLVPGSLLTIAGGALFGPLPGAGLAVAGGGVAATIAFVIGRRLGRADVERLSSATVTQLDRWLVRHGVASIAIVRIVPGVPYSLLNYAAGVTGIRTRDYVLGSVLGLVPGGVAYATVGSTLHDPASVEFAGAVALVLAVLAAGLALDRRLRRRQAGE